MPISLQKGQKVELTKATPGLQNITVGLGWDTNRYDGGADFDLDACIFMLGSNGKVLSDQHFIFYSNPSDPAGSVIHNGDNRTGAGDGDDEQIAINLTKVPEDVQKIVFSVTIHEADSRNQNFGQVSNAFIRIMNDAGGEELIRYDLGEDFSIETALVVAEIYRHSGEFKFSAVGAGFSGGLYALCQNFGVDV